MIDIYQNIVTRDSIVTLARARPRQHPRDAGDLQEFLRRDEFFKRIDGYLEKAKTSPLRMSIPGNAYVINTGSSAIALTGATARTIMYNNAAAANQPSFVEFCVSFDGVTASAVPALVELCYGTKASNSTPGTASTTFVALQVRGWPTQASASASANACTTEPTVLTSLKQWLVSPNGGLLLIQFPMGREPTGVASGTAISGNQVAWRVNAPAAVNCRGYAEFEE